MKLAIRLLLAALFSPLWLPMGLLVALAIFTAEGEWHWMFYGVWEWE